MSGKDISAAEVSEVGKSTAKRWRKSMSVSETGAVRATLVWRAKDISGMSGCTDSWRAAEAASHTRCVVASRRS